MWSTPVRSIPTKILTAGLCEFIQLFLRLVSLLDTCQFDSYTNPRLAEELLPNDTMIKNVNILKEQLFSVFVQDSQWTLATRWKCVERLHRSTATGRKLRVHRFNKCNKCIEVSNRRFSATWHQHRSLCVPWKQCNTIFIGYIERGNRESNDHLLESELTNFQCTRFPKNSAWTI